MATLPVSAITLHAKQGSDILPLHPRTAANLVAINNAQGTASNVQTEIEALRQLVNSAVDAGVHFKGAVTLTSGLPTENYKAGHQFVVKEAGTYAGQRCEVGDLILCVKDYAAGSASNADFTVIQANIVGAVTGPASATAGHIAVFDGATGKIIKDSGFTIATSVPAGAVFTDTTYEVVTSSKAGLMSSAMLATVNDYTTNGFKKNVDTADNITDGTTKVMMTATERTKLNGIAEGAEVNQNAFSNVKVGATTFASTTKTDTVEFAAGAGVTLSAEGKKVTIAETYIDSCVVTDLGSVPSNLRDGGVIFLKG